MCLVNRFSWEVRQTAGLSLHTWWLKEVFAPSERGSLGTNSRWDIFSANPVSSPWALQWKPLSLPWRKNVPNERRNWISFCLLRIHLTPHLSFIAFVVCAGWASCATALSSGDTTLWKMSSHASLFPRKWSLLRTEVIVTYLVGFVRPGIQHDGNVTQTHLEIIWLFVFVLSPISLRKRALGHQVSLTFWEGQLFLAHLMLVRIKEDDFFLKTCHCHLLGNCHCKCAASQDTVWRVSLNLFSALPAHTSCSTFRNDQSLQPVGQGLLSNSSRVVCGVKLCPKCLRSSNPTSFTNGVFL